MTQNFPVVIPTASTQALVQRLPALDSEIDSPAPPPPPRRTSMRRRDHIDTDPPPPPPPPRTTSMRLRGPTAVPAVVESTPPPPSELEENLPPPPYFPSPEDGALPNLAAEDLPPPPADLDDFPPPSELEEDLPPSPSFTCGDYRCIWREQVSGYLMQIHQQALQLACLIANTKRGMPYDIVVSRSSTDYPFGITFTSTFKPKKINSQRFSSRKIRQDLEEDEGPDQVLMCTELTPEMSVGIFSPPTSKSRAPFPVFNDRLRHQVLLGDEIRYIDGQPCSTEKRLASLTRGKLSVCLRVFRPPVSIGLLDIALADVLAKIVKMDHTYTGYASQLPAVDRAVFEEMMQMKQFRFFYDQLNDQVQAEAELIRAVRTKDILSIRRALHVSGIVTTIARHPIPPVALAIRSTAFKMALTDARCLGEGGKGIMHHLNALLAAEKSKKEEWERMIREKNVDESDVDSMFPIDFEDVVDPATVHKQFSAAVVNGLKNGLGESREDGPCHDLLREVHALITTLAGEKKAVRQLESCIAHCARRLKLETGLEKTDMDNFDGIVKPALRICRKRPWSSYTVDIACTAVAMRKRMSVQLSFQNQLRKVLSINKRRTLATHQHVLLETHQHVLLEAKRQIEKSITRARELGCEFLLVVKDAQLFLDRLESEANALPTHLDGCFGGAAELSGQWRGKSIHGDTGEATEWEDLTIIFTPDDTTASCATGVIQGNGYSVFREKRYEFALTGDFDFTSGIVNMKKVHLFDTSRVSYFGGVRMTWNKEQDRRLMVSAGKLTLIQVESHATHRTRSAGAANANHVEMK